MTQDERRMYLIRSLIDENEQHGNIEIPDSEDGQKKLLRALFNVRMPKKASGEFLRIQNEYLKAELDKKGITDYKSLTPIKKEIYLWQGDITTLRCAAIVNAANSQMLGCFCPNHGCIDNAIHTFSGVELRMKCAQIMKSQGHEEPVGDAKITPAYNLPCEHVIHTVGPIIHGRVRQKDEDALADCYLSCLKLAEQSGVKSIAFCCISTGEFHFPNERAAKLAINTVCEYKKKSNSNIEVIFNVFKKLDYDIYRKLLTEHSGT